MVITIRAAQDAGSVVVDEFVVLTAVHIVRAYPESAQRHAGYRANVIQFWRDIDPDNRDVRSECTGSMRPARRACATRTHMNG